eukprot:s374_g30.t1
MQQQQGAVSASSQRKFAVAEVDAKLTEAICTVQELMHASAESSRSSTTPPSFSYAKIAHLALLLCRSELAKEVAMDDTPREEACQGGAWTTQRVQQHNQITNAIAHLTDMLYAPNSPNREEEIPDELRPAAKAITVYAPRDGDINLSHLVKYCYHKDVPYYTLEFILVWPAAQGLEQLYCKHFFAVDNELHAADLPLGWGKLSSIPTILHRVSLHCTGFKHYPFQQHSMLVHTSGATISGGSTEETNRVAWHVAYHEADTLNIGVINEQIHFDSEMSTMVRRAIPSPMKSGSAPMAERKNPVPANLMLGRIWVHLQSAMQLTDTSQELENVKADLAEVKDRVQAILNAQLNQQSDS